MKILFDEFVRDHNPDCDVAGSYRLSGFSPNRLYGDTTIAENLMKLVHTRRHIEKIRCACFKRQEMAESPLSPDTYESCLRTLSAGLEAATNNHFAIARPPGHHAKREEAKGFCLINNMAILARHLKNLGERVFIFDFDVHHGDGTQDTFYTDPDVFYFSMHEEGIWPYTGNISEIGGGPGKGATANLPLPVNSGDDVLVDSLEVVSELIRKFRPTKIGVSAGFDAYEHDSLGNLRFGLKGYQNIGKVLRAIGIPVFGILEGGYHADVCACVNAFVAGINGERQVFAETSSDSETRRVFRTNRNSLLKKLN